MQWPLQSGISVVLFAGMGGACDGLEAAGFPVAVAVNHDAKAIAAHKFRHGHVRHIQDDIRRVDPLEATEGKPVFILWASPDCRHFSRARGGAPTSESVRSLPWEIIKWVKATRPQFVFLENVPEIRKWEKWEAWKAALRALGYAFEDRDLVCADYGVPTIRKRLFGIARRDGQPIIWPKPTHAPRDKAKERGLLPWVGANTCIDFSIPCPSIFGRKKELADKTKQRIANGIMRYVVNAADPFIVSVTHTKNDGYSYDINDPLKTVTTAKGGEFALVNAFVTPVTHAGGEDRVYDTREPMKTVTAAHRGEFALVSGFLAKHYTGVVGQDLVEPVPTVTTVDHSAVVAAHLVQVGYGERKGQRPRAMDVTAPQGTVVASAVKNGLVAATLVRDMGMSKAADIREPAPTVMPGGMGKTRLVAAFLTQYYSSGGQSSGLSEPLAAVTTRDRHALVTVEINGETYVITDIGMRMLEFHELARAHGFDPDTYPETLDLPDVKNWKVTKKAKVAWTGNSVPPLMAKVLSTANASPALMNAGISLRRAS